MEYVLTLQFDPAWNEAVANRCFEIGVRAIEESVEDEGCLKIYTDDERSARTYARHLEDYLAALAELWPDAPPYQSRIEPLGDVNWAEAWKAHFHPIVISERLAIRPSWETFDPAPGQQVLIVDPQMAFGTGSHETTRLALEAIDRLMPEMDPTAKVLDLGCGTGILAIAAVKLRLRRIIGVDHDETAVACASDNAAANEVADRCEFVAGELDVAPGAFDLIIANITADVLEPLAPFIRAKLESGGRALLTGILTTQAERVVATYEDAGMRSAERRDMGEWTLLEMEKVVP